MESFLARLVKDTRIGPYAVYRGVAPARPARLADPNVPWPAGAREALPARLADPNVPWPAGAREALAALGIERLYAHQAEALECAVRGQNVLLATPTASGKTLAYLLAFLAARGHDDSARAIFLYPLKALARDQLAVVRRVLAPLGYSAAE
nr:DEAD/DEAH box helicase [Acidobacteriota bacterium]